MITDRTLNDVTEAKKIRASKIQKFIELTDEETAIVEKGLITLNTLNRIEIKQAEVDSMLYRMGYTGGEIVNKYWSNATYFNEYDLQRIVDNVATLRKKFFVVADTPRNPKSRFDYIEFNNIEKILVDIETMIDDMKSYYRECDTFYCGE